MAFPIWKYLANLSRLYRAIPTPDQTSTKADEPILLDYKQLVGSIGASPPQRITFLGFGFPDVPAPTGEEEIYPLVVRPPVHDAHHV